MKNINSLLHLILCLCVSLNLRAADKSPKMKKSPSFFRKSAQIDLQPITIHENGASKTLGYINKLEDDSNQSPYVYYLYGSDKKNIAKVHVHTVNPKHLWISPDSSSNDKKIRELLGVWKQNLDISQDNKGFSESVSVAITSYLTSPAR